MGEAPAAARGRWLWLVVAAVVAAVCVASAVGAWAQGVHVWFLLICAGLAGAVVFAAGLVVPAAIGRRDRRAAELKAEQERAARIEADLWAVMRPLSRSASPGSDPGSPDGSPAALLRPERQLVGFIGRDDELRGLRAWARGSTRGVVRLITGPGGAGKTRLAVEFAGQLEAIGWRCGLLQADHGRQAIAAIAAAEVPTLLVVDYAEARTDLSALLEALAAHRSAPVIRVLLLARTLGQWWQPDGPLRRQAAIRDVLVGAEAIELGPLTTIPLLHQKTFHAAKEAFASHYGIAAPATTLRPVAEDTPVLLLHAAALTAVLDALQGKGSPASVAATEDIVAELLGHEGNYWSGNAAAHGLDQLGVGPDTYRQVVSITGLLGADGEQEARDVLRRLPVLVDATALAVGRVLGWLCELYPSTSSSWLGSLQPDLLLEYLVTSVFSDSGELTDAALTDLFEHHALHALAVLARALDHYPACADQLLRRLLMGHADILAMPAVQLGRNLDNPALGTLLADIFADAPLTPQVLAALAADLRQVPTSLVAAAAAVYLRVGADQFAAGQLGAALDTAVTLMSLVEWLEQRRFYGPAADVGSAALTLVRALEEAEPARYRVSLAATLAARGVTLSNLGQEQDAHRVKVEAVNLYRVLEQAEPGSHRAGLARALTGLGVTLSNLGQHQEAQLAETEAVELYWAAEEAEPGSHRAGLARTLSGLGATLSSLGQYQEAQLVEAEAVEFYRAAEQAEPGNHRVHLAVALTNLGSILSDLGQYQEAQLVEAEAVELYRTAEQAEPSRYRAHLAAALTNLGFSLSHLGQNQKARQVEAEAVELDRTRFSGHPA